MSRFIDAPAAVRCTKDITLGDGSTAQCGRRGTKGGRCWQHWEYPQLAGDQTVCPCGGRVRPDVKGEYLLCGSCCQRYDFRAVTPGAPDRSPDA